MTRQLQESNQKAIYVDQFDEADWEGLIQTKNTDHSWPEIAFLAGWDYFETDKALMRSY